MNFSFLIDRALAVSPAQSWFQFRARSHVTVLAYHEVRDAARFYAQMDYVHTHLCPVDVAAVCAAVQAGTPLPERAALVTFDDGHRSILETALPILSERGIPAVVYVVAGLLDTDQPYWWEEVEALVEQGGYTEYVAGGMSPLNVARALKRIPNEDRLAAIQQLRDTASAPAPRMPQLRRSDLPVLEAGGIAVGTTRSRIPAFTSARTPRSGTNWRRRSTS